MGNLCATCFSRYAGQPGSGRCLLHFGGYDVFEGRCGIDRTGFTPPAYELRHRLALTRSGAFLVRVNGEESFMEGGSLTLTRPGDELRFAHPLGCGDTFTAVEFVPAEGAVAALRPVLDDRDDLRHRALVAELRRGTDPFTAAERLHDLLGRVLTGDGFGEPERRRAATVAAHRRLVDRARQALVADDYTLGLDDLAGLTGCSPYHLSRIFRRVTGETMTDYRNRRRVRAVLADLQDGAVGLRELAARYGFADQAHMTRVMRQRLGHLPSELRRLLAPPA